VLCSCGGLVGSPFEDEHEAEPEEVREVCEGSAGPLETDAEQVRVRRSVGDVERLLESLDPSRERAVDDGGDELVFVLEVPVDGADRKPGSLAHEVDGRAFVAALAGDLSGGGEDLLARCLSVGASTSGCGPVPACHRLDGSTVVWLTVAITT